MKVVCVVTADGMSEGTVAAVLELPEGTTQDEVFVAWLKGEHSFYAKKTHDECLTADGYAWHTNTVQKISLPTKDKTP